jgi:hypothetical protein
MIEPNNPLPEPVKMRISMYVDRSMSMSIDNSPLISAGEVIGRGEFLYEEETKRGLIVQAFDNTRLHIEVPGVGVVMVTLADLTHQMTHALIGDDECDCVIFDEPEGPPD